MMMGLRLGLSARLVVWDYYVLHSATKGIRGALCFRDVSRKSYSQVVGGRQDLFKPVNERLRNLGDVAQSLLGNCPQVSSSKDEARAHT